MTTNRIKVEMWMVFRRLLDDTLVPTVDKKVFDLIEAF